MNRIWAFVVVMFCVLVFSSSAQAKSVGMAGTWKSSDPTMVAKISKQRITIYWTANGSSALYWKGSFPKHMRKGDKTVSEGDTEIMDTSLLASTESRKSFTYSHGKLRFSLSAFGVNTTVYLSR